ncbi:putative metal-binding motif-containing protein, partial [Patescibacteria group bacterium]|nr:putative metal-binding motif-containing protein [Patescibacteria group bacterium]MCG2687937.1 putative metal-binding motif-containing protein [Candidatus Parcubacteria bacterium]
ADADTDTGYVPVDADGDSYTDDVDCDDSDASINPAAAEICNGVDDNCDGTVDDGACYECADDLGEGLEWLCVDGTDLAFGFGSLSWSSTTPDPEDVVITGTGLESAWTYTAYLGDYELGSDLLWFTMGGGNFRVTLLGPSDSWALYYGYCMVDETSSELCNENTDGTYSLCFQSDGSQISPLSDEDCAELEE